MGTEAEIKRPTREELLAATVEHIDIKSFDATPIVEAMCKMSFTAGDTGRACKIFERMLTDPDCSVILSLAGSTSAAGCMQVYVDMLKSNMIDAVVATGASIVDMDFFEALGFKHYRGSAAVDDRQLRDLFIDRIYDTYIDEHELQECDGKVKELADTLVPGVYSSRGFIREMGRWLTASSEKKGSLIEVAFENDVPIFCPAFSDSSAGFGLVMHQTERPEGHVSIDSVRDFRELTQLKIQADTTGLLIVGGGVPKNFIQDTVVCAELLGREVPLHKYAVQITVADPRDGGCSGSTLREACSWGKVDVTYEQMVFAEATSIIPLLGSYAYHRGSWRARKPRGWSRLFD
jgi:deoxyhypusine synthase